MASRIVTYAVLVVRSIACSTAMPTGFSLETIEGKVIGTQTLRQTDCSLSGEVEIRITPSFAVARVL